MARGLDRADFWEFKARTLELDLEAASLKLKLAALGERKNALVDAFAAAHGLDPTRPITLEDTDCSVTQEPHGAAGRGDL